MSRSAFRTAKSSHPAPSHRTILSWIRKKYAQVMVSVIELRVAASGVESLECIGNLCNASRTGYSHKYANANLT
jgi:hypothetical protein